MQDVHNWTVVPYENPHAKYCIRGTRTDMGHLIEWECIRQAETSICGERIVLAQTYRSRRPFIYTTDPRRRAVRY